MKRKLLGLVFALTVVPLLTAGSASAAPATSHSHVLASGGISSFLEGPDFNGWSGAASLFKHLFGLAGALAILAGCFVIVVSGVLFAFSGHNVESTTAVKHRVKWGAVAIAIGTLAAVVIPLFISMIQALVK